MLPTALIERLNKLSRLRHPYKSLFLYYNVSFENFKQSIVHALSPKKDALSPEERGASFTVFSFTVLL